MSARVASIPDLVTQTTAFALILFSGLAPMTAEPANIRLQLSVIVPNRFMRSQLVSGLRRGDDAATGIDAVTLRVVAVAEFVARDRLGRGLGSLRVVRDLAGQRAAGAVD